MKTINRIIAGICFFVCTPISAEVQSINTDLSVINIKLDKEGLSLDKDGMSADNISAKIDCDTPYFVIDNKRVRINKSGNSTAIYITAKDSIILDKLSDSSKNKTHSEFNYSEYIICPFDIPQEIKLTVKDDSTKTFTFFIANDYPQFGGLGNISVEVFRPQKEGETKLIETSPFESGNTLDLMVNDSIGKIIVCGGKNSKFESLYFKGSNIAVDKQKPFFGDGETTYAVNDIIRDTTRIECTLNYSILDTKGEVQESKIILFESKPDQVDGGSNLFYIFIRVVIIILVLCGLIYIIVSSFRDEENNLNQQLESIKRKLTEYNTGDQQEINEAIERISGLKLYSSYWELIKRTNINEKKNRICGLQEQLQKSELDKIQNRVDDYMNEISELSGSEDIKRYLSTKLDLNKYAEINEVLSALELTKPLFISLKNDLAQARQNHDAKTVAVKEKEEIKKNEDPNNRLPLNESLSENDKQLIRKQAADLVNNYYELLMKTYIEETKTAFQNAVSEVRIENENNAVANLRTQLEAANSAMEQANQKYNLDKIAWEKKIDALTKELNDEKQSRSSEIEQLTKKFQNEKIVEISELQNSSVKKLRDERENLATLMQNHIKQMFAAANVAFDFSKNDLKNEGVQITEGINKLFEWFQQNITYNFHNNLDFSQKEIMEVIQNRLIRLCQQKDSFGVKLMRMVAYRSISKEWNDWFIKQGVQVSELLRAYQELLGLLGLCNITITVPALFIDVYSEDAFDLRVEGTYIQDYVPDGFDHRKSTNTVRDLILPGLFVSGKMIQKPLVWA